MTVGTNFQIHSRHLLSLFLHNLHTRFRKAIIQNLSSVAMYTANTMACAAEAMGMSLPGSSTQAAISPEKRQGCFEAGQAHKTHTHEGMDKLYHVLDGTGQFQVGDEEFALGAGEQVFVPGGVPHGARNDGPDKLVVMVVLAPGPSK